MTREELAKRLREPKYPDLGPFLSLCHERQYDEGCAHQKQNAVSRCLYCIIDVGNELCDLALAALSGVPQGYALVPLEPTEEMIAAFNKSWLEITMPARKGPERLRDAYKAMLHTAPGKQDTV